MQNLYSYPPTTGMPMSQVGQNLAYAQFSSAPPQQTGMPMSQVDQNLAYAQFSSAPPQQGGPMPSYPTVPSHSNYHRRQNRDQYPYPGEPIPGYSQQPPYRHGARPGPLEAVPYHQQHSSYPPPTHPAKYGYPVSGAPAPTATLPYYPYADAKSAPRTHTTLGASPNTRKTKYSSTTYKTTNPYTAAQQQRDPSSTLRADQMDAACSKRRSPVRYNPLEDLTDPYRPQS